jgi:hypothetical protein
MHGAKAHDTPWFFFVAVAALWIVALLAAEPLYDFGTNLLRKLGRDRLADFRERLKPKVLPPARVALLIMALVSLVYAAL